MRRRRQLIKRLILPGIIILLAGLNSCIVDEYKVDKLKIDDNEWETQLTAPLFTAGIQLKDLVNYSAIPSTAGEPTITLNFQGDSSLRFPAEVLFEPYTLVDNFPFLIADEYELTEGKFIYIVTNGAPFPLNLQMDFYKSGNSENSLTFSAPPFAPAQPAGDSLLPVTTTWEKELSPEMLRFVYYSRVAFTTWFEREEPLTNTTLAAESPVELSVILTATVKEMRNEE